MTTTKRLAIWDALLRPRHQSTNASSNVIASRSHEYNKLGNITAIATDAGRTSYAYDKLGRLTDAEPNDKHRQLGLPEEKYLYDKVGNCTASGHQNGIWKHNADNQLTSYPRYFTTLADGLVMNEDIAVSYTATGHTKEEKGLKWERHYAYNAAERLTAVEDKRNYRTTSYTYDPFGRRISKTITQGKASQTTYYIYGEHGLMAEANEQGTLTKAYGFHPDAQANGLWGTNPVWQADVAGGKLKDANTQWHYLHTDHLGTPFMATNKQGQKTWRAYSQAFGEAVIDKNSTTTVNLRFPGQYFDEETGTHYNFQRDYNPYTGRYLQSDPIGLNGGLNLYGYANNNPLMYMDPEGEAVFIYFVPAIIWGTFEGIMSVLENEEKNPCATWGDRGKFFMKGFIYGAISEPVPILKIFKLKKLIKLKKAIWPKIRNPHWSTVALGGAVKDMSVGLTADVLAYNIGAGCGSHSFEEYMLGKVTSAHISAFAAAAEYHDMPTLWPNGVYKSSFLGQLGTARAVTVTASISKVFMARATGDVDLSCCSCR